MSYPDLRSALVKKLVSTGVIKSQPLRRAFLKVPREEFVSKELQKNAYLDEPLPIGSGATISQPTTIGIMLEAAAPKGRVLEVGSGSGYVLALLAELVQEVIGLEIVPELAENSKTTLEKLGYSNIEVLCANGFNGLEPRAPFDCIIVSAAAHGIPASLLKQLASPGRLVIPVGIYSQELLLVEKQGPTFKRTSLGAFSFVPLVSEKNQPPNPLFRKGIK